MGRIAKSFSTLQEISQAATFDAISPVKGPEQPSRKSVYRDEDLGVLTSWFNNIGDRSTVFRTWGLMDGGKYYGPRFSWSEYMRVSGWISAIFFYIVLKLFAILPIFPPFR